MNSRVAEVLSLQGGTIRRSQTLDLGLRDHDIRRLVRRREWVPIHTGVYVDHTGELTWLQRAWGGVHLYWPAALSHESARRAADGRGRRRHDESGPIHVAVDRDRTLHPPSGIVVHRLADLESKVLWNTSPPRQRLEEAVIDLAAEATSPLDAVGHVADAVQARLTTATRLADALCGRTRVARRTFLASVIEDVARGTCSTLEHGYLDRVERPHGLPTADRQLRDSLLGPLYRDAVYTAHGLIVELDGRLFHSSTHDRDRDMDRDLDAALLGRDTARLGWGQVFARSCRTAARIGVLLQSRGWSGRVRRCADCPPDIAVLSSHLVTGGNRHPSRTA